jgi:hypothetical protein
MASLLDLFISIGVKDNASKEVQSLSSKLGKGLQTAAKVGVAAVGAASTAIAAIAKQGVQSFAEYEQLSGGAAKIFGDALAPSIFADAQNAYKDLNMSANEYLATINDVGATFSATMGAEAGYETARKGLQAISDYATGTGKDVGLLSQKFTMITRSASSYQSIADQFSGVLPATSAAFLEQAQAAGFLEDSYKNLTEVPIEEYQAAVASMLEKGVAALNLTGNTAAEAFNTLSGSISATRAAWSNLLTGLVDDSADFDTLFNNFVTSATAAVQQLIPRITTTLAGIGTLITQLAPILAEAFPTLVESVVPSLLSAGAALLTALIQGIVMAFPTLVQSATDIILTLITTLTANSEAVVSTAITLISTLAMGLLTALPQIIAAALALVAALIESIIQKFPEILDAGNQIVAKLGEGITNVLDAVFEAGASIVQSIIDGIASAWDGLVSWFEGLWSSLFSNRNVSVGVTTGGGGADGSHASGLDYVPFDNYMARLHKGETVLNAEDARNYRMGGGQSVPFELTINNVTELDGATISRKTYKYNLQQQSYHGAKLINA